MLSYSVQTRAGAPSTLLQIVSIRHTTHITCCIISGFLLIQLPLTAITDIQMEEALMMQGGFSTD